MRSKFALLVLLTCSAAAGVFAADPPPTALTPINTRDQKVIKRWSITGDPRGLAIGTDGTIYVGLAQPQAVIAVDPKSGTILRRVVLDSADIASTKELVTMRTNREGTRLYIANGSDESATILSLPDLAIVREITIEGEPIRDAVPDPKGHYLYLLGRTVHVYTIDGEKEIHAIEQSEPMAIAVSGSGSTLAVLANFDFGGGAKATAVLLYDTTSFRQFASDPLQTTDRIDGALFTENDRALVAVSSQHFFEKDLVVKPAKAMTADAKGAMRMPIGFGDLVNSQRICLPAKSGPQIVTTASGSLVAYAERRCDASGGFTGSPSHVATASLYGVDAYAVAFLRSSNALVATEPRGFLTIYKLPRSFPVN